MSTATPDLIKSTPSPLRIGLVGSRFTVVLYLLVVGFQFLINFAINGIIYLSVSDVTKNIEQTATNSAVVTAVFLFICGIILSPSIPCSSSWDGSPSLSASTRGSSFFSHGWRATEPGASLVDFPVVSG